MANRFYPPVSPYSAGLRAKCPRCGEGRLFSGFLTIADRCDNCGLDYHFADSGDGPAVFLILILGFIVCGAALWVEVAFQPPYWVHAVVWLPVTLVLAIGLLRPMKATMLALQYHHAAREGRISD